MTDTNEGNQPRKTPTVLLEDRWYIQHLSRGSCKKERPYGQEHQDQTMWRQRIKVFCACGNKSQSESHPNQ